MGRAAKLAAAN